MLVPVADGDCLILMVKNVESCSKVNGVHPLRTLRTQHALVEVNKAAVGGKEWLKPSQRPKIRLKSNRADAAAVGTRAQSQIVRVGSWMRRRPIEHGESGDLR